MAGENLDARLLRFRNDPATEDPGALAKLLLDAERAREALEVAGVHLRLNPRDGQMLVLAGRAWMVRGDLLRAQKTLLQAARAQGNAPEPYRWLGEVLLRRGDPERAEKVLTRAKKLGASGAEVDRLHQRAQRLARIAGGADAPEPAPPPKPAPKELFRDDEEPTMVAADLSRRLAEAAADSEPPPPPVIDEAAPTATMDRSALDAAAKGGSYGMGSPSPFEAKKKPARRPKIRKPTAPKPLRPRPKPAPPVAPPVAAPPAPPPLTAPEPPALEDPFASPIPFGDDPFADSGAEPLGDPFDLDSDPLVAAPDLARQSDPFAEPTKPSQAVVPAPEPAPPAADPFADDDPFSGADPLLAPEPPPSFETSPSLEPSFEPSFDAPPAPPAADVASGGAAGQPENVDRILTMLKDQHLFEPPEGEAAPWAPAKDVKKTGQRIALPLGVLWVLALLIAGGGYFGYTQWVAHQESEAAAMVAEASADALRGDHKDLVDAERLVREARELHPLDAAGPALLIFVHSQRALEDGAFEPGYLRPTVEFGSQREVGPARIAAAEAILAYASGNAEEGAAKITAAKEAGADDAVVLYVVGRLQQRLGEASATENLTAALAAEEGLTAAAIALAEAKTDEGQPEAAMELLDGVLGRYEGHLRATLWRAYLSADDAQPEAGLQALAPIDDRMEEAAPTDKVLLALTRARLMRRLGRTEDAEAQIEAATAAGASEPRMQALVASSAQALGQLGRAQTAAMAAVSSAPAIPDYRKLLAEILVERRDGVRALRVLGPLSNEDPDVLDLSTRAALLVGGTDAIEAASGALDSYLEEHDDASAAMKALQIRVAVRMGRARDVLREARRLARDNPGDPEVGLAVADAALAARDARLAREAATGVTAADPTNAEAHYLLGRVERMAGDAEEAETALRRALELQSTHTDAQLLLGHLLIDQGKFAEADTLYGELARRVGRSGSGRSYSLVGRLGRVEALLGLGRVDDAKVQLENVRQDDRELATVKVVTARVALADGRPGDAVRALRPLAQSEQANADVISLLGDALYAANEPRAASDQYERALELDDGHPEALLGFATVLLRGDKAREARGILERADVSLRRRIRPPSMRARALMLQGRIAVEEGNDSIARRLLRESADMDGTPPETWFYLGEALAGSDSPAAREAYSKYLELAPAGPLARRARRAIR
ncbi:MAG: tetratricopeptide repeat protein [Myxococcota bacterium]